MTQYGGHQSDVVAQKGGSVRMTIAANVAQGNGGTSLPCRKVYLLGNANDIRVRVDSGCAADTGIALPYFIASAAVYMQPWELAIDDVSKLYFYSGTNGNTIDCLYVL